MSWNSSWGKSGFSRNGWGSSSWSGSNSCHRVPEGQHYNQCIAGHTWGNNSVMGMTYDERCSGCRHHRVGSTWGSCKNDGNPVLKLAGIFGVGTIAKKSLWD